MVQSESKPEQEALPFVAPCRQIEVTEPIEWLKLGWRDFTTAPRVSLIYGIALMILSYLVAYFTWQLGGAVLILSLLSGFIFIAPVLALGLYSISCQLQAGMRPQLGYCLRQGKRHLGNELVYSMILLVIFLLWARAASMIHVFFPVEAHPHFADLATFLAIGSAVGTLFAGLVFSASAFSLPMMLDRKVDTITAVITSVNAVLRNKGAMVVWALIIVIALGISFATAFLGLAVLMPVLGYMTWHAYQATIQPDAWPEHSKVPAE
ncbi:MAG: DUF2189 domain-containing protein [Thiohalomonadales bacterium]|nr:DUF2189 domain-containing protein [Thiohalomonadales bacterium]